MLWIYELRKKIIFRNALEFFFYTNASSVHFEVMVKDLVILHPGRKGEQYEEEEGTISTTGCRTGIYHTVSVSSINGPHWKIKIPTDRF